MRAAALLLAGVLSGLALSPAAATADFRGTVVDAQSGEPLEGAVVIVVWRRYPFGVFTHVSPIPYKTIETLTDTAGRFTADDSPGFAPPPFHSRDVFVYKPGYRVLRVHARDKRAALLPHPVAGLTKATTRGDAREAVQEVVGQVHICIARDQSACVPRERVSHLMRLADIQRKLFEPYPAGHFGAEEPPR